MARPTITTHPVEVTDSGHLTEFLYDDGENDAVLVCAGHAGDVEPGTGEQAIELATRVGASCWACFGYDGDVGAFDAFHPPSSEIDPDAYPLLGEVAGREFDTVLSLHGLGEDRVVVGGGVDQETRLGVHDRIDAALSIDVEAVSEGPYAGRSPENFVNWLAADGGLQLELGTTARSVESEALLDALADLLREGVL